MIIEALLMLFVTKGSTAPAVSMLVLAPAGPTLVSWDGTNSTQTPSITLLALRSMLVVVLEKTWTGQTSHPTKSEPGRLALWTAGLPISILLPWSTPAFACVTIERRK